MVRELLLMRHSQYDPYSAASDRRCSLKKRGQRDAQRLGVWLDQQNCHPLRVLTSPTDYSLATAVKCIKASGGDPHIISSDERLYCNNLDELLNLLAEQEKRNPILMLVGHKAELLALYHYLTQKEPTAKLTAPKFPSGALLRLKLHTPWNHLNRGCATLVQSVTPESLPRLFPYPDAHGTEYRSRPAYYYTQSSVIPYRITAEGAVEILIISASHSDHWVVPKGTKEPGLSAQDSAAQEALEEAGVFGEVSRKPLGTYFYPKWEANCMVEVFAMEVTGMVEDHHWLESHRGRRWVDPQTAIDQLQQQPLTPMIHRLVSRLESRDR